MSRRKIYSFIAFAFLVIFTWIFLASDDQEEAFSERVKVSLRDVGNQLLHSNQDATSLVYPVIELEKSKYQFSFQHELAIEPDSLVSIVESSFQKAGLPDDYRVEVIQCADQEVAYSYEVKNLEENNIIPCRGRTLPENCYTIEVRFTNIPTIYFSNQRLLYSIIFIVFFIILFILYKRKQHVNSEEIDKKYSSIGSFLFYPDQNKLVKEAKEISLSKKECELLAIFIANPNQIIKRDELTKRVWEDHGVIVGRSLDTYISKLRKILKDDDSIKLSNVHGVGYKLEIEI